MKLMMRAIETLLFDLDDTLYPKSSGLMNEVGHRIDLYIQREFSYGPAQATQMRTKYRERYGSSLVGLVHIEKINPQGYIDFVYDIDYPAFITPNPCLTNVLQSFGQDKILYTNASRVHAEAVMDLLEIGGMMKQIVAIEDVGYYAKPMKESFEGMLALTGITPRRTLFFDDQKHNLLAASRFGFYTALVGGESDGVNLCLEAVTHFSAAHIGRL